MKGKIEMWYRNLKSTLFRTISSLSVAGLVLAGAFVAFTAPSLRAVKASEITPPPLPDGLAPVPAGNKLFLGSHAIGTQNYVCKPSGAGVAYVLFTPEATLFGDDGGQIITHFFSPNPNPSDPNTDPKVVADGAIRATWQYKDTSAVWAKVHQPNGAVTVDPTAIAWLTLDAVGTQKGPTGGDKLFGTTFVQRLNTTGGVAPSTGCSSISDVGNTAFVPYTADYFFYKAAN